MPVKINNVSFFSELQGVSDDPVDWALANVGDKIRIELEFSVETFAISSSDNTIRLNAKDGYIGDGWVIDTNNRFKDFQVGDVVSIDNYFANTHTDTRTIIQKLSDNEIQFDADITGPANNDDSAQVVFSVTKPIQAIRYKYNFIENNDSDTFNSKVSGTEQILIIKIIDADDPTVLDMEFLGELSYQIGSATINGVDIIDANGNVVYESKFKIIHETIITPFMLSLQWDDILDDISPDYFFNANCLKAIFDIEAMYNYTDPNRIQTDEITTVKGNTGWFNENFNSGVTNYSKSVVFKNSTSEIVDALQLRDDDYTSFSITITNIIDAPFSNHNTKFALKFCKAPFDQSEYQLNGRSMAKNFVFDQLLQKVGEASVNGDNYGGAMQVLKDVSASWTSNSVIVITGKVLLGSDALSILSESQTSRYLLWVSIQDHRKEMVDADKVSLLIHASDFFIETADDNMIVSVSKILRHPETDPETQGLTPAGEVLAKFQFSTYTLGDNVELIDLTNGNTIAVADWTTDRDTTMNLLIDSLNNNVSHGTVFGGAPARDNSAGYTGRWDLVGGIVKTIVVAPVGSGSSGNGISIKILWSGGNTNTFPLAGGFGPIAIDAFPEDELVAYTKSYLDLSGREDDDIQLTSIETRIKVKNTSTLDEFTLDSFALQLSSFEKVGPVQYFKFGTDRSFHIPEGTIRKQVVIQRRTDLDASDKYYFESWYPFLFRWEYWESLKGVAPDFFDVDLPNNGLNHFWHHYQTGNWKIYYETIIKAKKNGNIQTYKQELILTSHDWNSNADYTSTIKSYDPDTNTEQVSGGLKRILGYKNTLIKSAFTKISAAPVLANSTINVRVEVFEQGGIKGSRRMSSKWPSDSDTWFRSIDETHETKLSLAGNTITGQCLVDFSKIPSDAKYKISARVYEIDLGGTGKLEEDGTQKLTEDGSFKIIE